MAPLCWCAHAAAVTAMLASLLTAHMAWSCCLYCSLAAMPCDGSAHCFHPAFPARPPPLQINVYVPNAGDRPARARLPYKLRFLEARPGLLLVSPSTCRRCLHHLRPSSSSVIGMGTQRTHRPSPC